MAKSLPVSMRITYVPSENIAFFRLRTFVQACSTDSTGDTHAYTAADIKPTIEAATEPATDTNSAVGPNDAEITGGAETLFYLDILPTDIQTLSIHDNTIHFHFKSSDSITLIAPNSLGPFYPTTVSDSLAAVGLLAISSTIRVLVPDDGIKLLESLLPLCSAISREDNGLHAKLKDIDKRSLYHGNGGRVVDIRVELLHPTGLDGGADSLPTYSSIRAASQSPSHRPQKRPRIFSSSEASTSASIKRTIFYRDPDINEGEEMLQRLIDKETQVRGLLQELDVKIVVLNKKSRDEDLKSAAMDKKSRAMDVQLIAVERAIRALDTRSISLHKKNIALDKKILSMTEKIAKMDEKRIAMDAKCASMTALIEKATKLEHSLIQVQAQLTDTSDGLQDDDISDAVGVPAVSSPCQSEISTATHCSTPHRRQDAPAKTTAAPTLPPSLHLRRYIASQIDRLRSEINAYEYATKLDVKDELDRLDVRRDDGLDEAVNQAVEEELDDRVEGIEKRVINAVRESIRESLA